MRVDKVDHSKSTTLARDLYEALANGDRQRLVKLLHPQFVGHATEGLPLGLQLIGRAFDEESLFSLGHVIEQAAGRFSPQRWW